MKNKDITDDEMAEFRDAVKNVKKMTQEELVNLPRFSSLKKKIAKQIFDDEKELPLLDRVSPEVSGADELFFAHPGLQQKVMRDLRTGKIIQTAILDLHGMTVTQARSAVIRFIKQCQKVKCRCARIVHGKGVLKPGQHPILKNHVNSWLQQHLAVMAFCTAAKKDGGTGAVYVLLRREE